VAKKIDGRTAELAFVDIDDETILVQSVEELPEVVVMLFVSNCVCD